MEKSQLIIVTILGILMMLAIQSCTDHFDELNTSPTLVGPDVVDPHMLLANSIRAGAYQIPNYSGLVNEITGYRISPASGNVFITSTYNSPWNMYTNQIISVSEMIRLTEGEEFYANSNAMARIWRVWLFQQITDHYGDIPYFEAALAQAEAVPHPAYDSQREIYIDMIEQLKKAAADLQASPNRVDIGNSDLIYGGDIEMWRRFANSLRLRYALRVRFSDEALTRQEIADVINAPLIADNSMNAQVMTLPDGTTHNSNRHPMFNENINALNPFACTNTMVYNMREVTSPDLDMDDPRLTLYCKPAPRDGAYRGRILNAGDGFRWFHTNDNVSRLGDRLLQADQPIKILTHAEVEFNKAEIYLAGLASGDAEAAYQAGIRADMEFYELDESEISAFLASSAGSLSGDEEENLRKISSQRWLSFYDQPTEGFNEWRRTGYPTTYLYAAQEGHTNGRKPRRLTYPTSEYDRNNEKLREALDRQFGGNDGLMNRVWWDARPGLPLEHPDDYVFPPPPDQHVTQEEFTQ